MIEPSGRRKPFGRAIRIVTVLGVLALLLVGLVIYGPTVAGRAVALLPASPFRGRAAAAPAKGFFAVEPGRAACGLRRGMTQWEVLQALKELGHPRKTAATGEEAWVFGDGAETYRTGSNLIGVRFTARSAEPQAQAVPSSDSRGTLRVEAIVCFRPSKLGSLTTGMTLTEAVAELGKPGEIFYWESDDPRGGGRPEEMVLAYQDQGLGVVVEVATNRVIGFMVLPKGTQ